MSETIVYRFFAKDEKPIDVPLTFRDDTFELVMDSADGPDWARLEFNKCANCTLTSAKFCPSALGLSTFLPRFATKVSHEKTVVEVDMATRTIVSKTDFQAAMASLIGLVCATSGCPRTRFLRPMARFHLPFATDRETVFRALAANLLAQYVAAKVAGREANFSLDQLKEAYGELSVVNSALAERLRSVAKRDAVLNAVIILDLFAQIAPENIDGGFEDILGCFIT